MVQDGNNSCGFFETTRWNVVLSCRDKDVDRSKRALDELCRAYWQPIYVFIRKRGHSIHDAEDLTQEFIAELLDREALKRVAPSKGKFRSFLLGSLKNFLSHQRARSQTQKRGGNCIHFTLDFPGAENLYESDLEATRTPEEIYELRWALRVIERARERLRGEYLAQGKAERFELLAGFLSGDPRGMTQKEAAARLAVSVSSVKSEVYRMKKQFGRHLLNEVAETVNQSQDIEAELQYLLKVVSR